MEPSPWLRRTVEHRIAPWRLQRGAIGRTAAPRGSAARTLRGGGAAVIFLSIRIADPAIGDFTSINNAIRVVPDVARHGVQVTVWQFLPSYIRQEALTLGARVLKAGELVTDFVSMKAAAIINVKIVSRHVSPSGMRDGS